MDEQKQHPTLDHLNSVLEEKDKKNRKIKWRESHLAMDLKEADEYKYSWKTMSHFHTDQDQKSTQPKSCLKSQSSIKLSSSSKNF